MGDVVSGGRKVFGRAICIYKWMPDGCPYKGCGKHLYGVARASGAPSNTRAFQCEEGHKCHVYEECLGVTHAEFLAAQVVDSHKEQP